MPNPAAIDPDDVTYVIRRPFAATRVFVVQQYNEKPGYVTATPNWYAELLEDGRWDPPPPGRWPVTIAAGRGPGEFDGS